MSVEPGIRRWAGCTLVLRSAVPHALVLANSFRKFHPESEFFILVVDGYVGTETQAAGVKLLSLSDVEPSPGDAWRLPMLFSAVDLLLILKPVLLRHVYKAGNAAAAYFDSDMEIFAPLDDVLAMTASRNIVLVDAAPAYDNTEAGGVVLAEKRNVSRSFIAVAATADEFLRKWLDRLAQSGLGESSNDAGDATETLDGAIDSYPHHRISDPGFDVGYWNLNPATFLWREDHYEVEGRPLRSFNFRGYDPDKPHLLSKHQGAEPRILLSQHPAVAKICDEHREQLIRAGYDKAKSLPYRFDVLPSGLPIDHRMLRLYREALTKFNQGLDREPPSPFGRKGEEGFLDWLNQPMGGAQPIITRYMLGVHEERDDVKQIFPDPTGADAVGFYDWYLHFGKKELDLSTSLLPPDAPPEVPDESIVESVGSTAPSVNVVGYFHAELGIGAAARALVAALEASEVPFNTISFAETASRQRHPFEQRQAEGGAPDINIICVNADQIATFAEKNGPEVLHGRYTIGVWFWEVEDFPEELHHAFNYVDEIWAASHFMRDTFLKVSPKPVFKFALPILKPQVDPSLSRADLGVPDRFVFLFNFDFLSVLERKNPLGLIQAFTLAFGLNEGPVLMIKTINGDKRVVEMEKLRYAAGFRPDIIVSDGYLSALEIGTLSACADCYVSLHRSEGFGLTIAEAMALGKPAIATAYSGNLEFMTEVNSYLCPYQRSEVGSEREPYPATSHWSEPDVEAAARLLRHVYAHQDEARDKGKRAAEDVLSLHSPEIAGAAILDRLTKIRHRRSTTPRMRTIAFYEHRLEELEAENQARGKCCNDKQT